MSAGLTCLPEACQHFRALINPFLQLARFWLRFVVARAQWIGLCRESANIAIVNFSEIVSPKAPAL